MLISGILHFVYILHSVTLLYTFFFLCSSLPPFLPLVSLLEPSASLFVAYLSLLRYSHRLSLPPLLPLVSVLEPFLIRCVDWLETARQLLAGVRGKPHGVLQARRGEKRKEEKKVSKRTKKKMRAKREGKRRDVPC